MPREIIFVETMKGHVSGREPLQLCDLVVRVSPVPGPDDGLPGELTGGTVRYGGRDYAVTAGRFVALAATPRGRRMWYRVHAESADHHRLDVAGVKRVTGWPWRWWADTSRMHVTVSTPDGAGDADGVVRLGPWAFARQLTTLRGRPVDVAAFVARFARRLTLPGRITGGRHDV